MKRRHRLLPLRDGPAPPAPSVSPPTSGSTAGDEAGRRHAACDRLCRPGDRCPTCGRTIPKAAA